MTVTLSGEVLVRSFLSAGVPREAGKGSGELRLSLGPPAPAPVDGCELDQALADEERLEGGSLSGIPARSTQNVVLEPCQSHRDRLPCQLLNVLAPEPLGRRL